MSTVKVDTIQTTGGASEIAIDKLKGVSSASSISVVAEGGTTTTNLQQGLTKAWAGIDSGASLENSFNVSSGDDDGSGNYGLNYTSNMSDANYSSVNTAEFSHNGTSQNPRVTVTNSRTTSSVEVDAAYVTGAGVFTFYDFGDLGVQVNGDLA